MYPLHYKGSRLRELHIDCGTERLLQLITTHCPSLYALHIRKGDYALIQSLHVLNDSSVKHLRLLACKRLHDSEIGLLRSIVHCAYTTAVAGTLVDLPVRA